MTIRYGGFNLKTVFAVVVLTATGLVVLLSFKVHLRGSSVSSGGNKRIFEGSGEDAKVHVHKFNIRGNDIIVFLHLQKTGGSKFGLQLVKNLDIERPCRCSRPRKSRNGQIAPTTPKVKYKRVCHCLRPGSSKIWLFSRHSLGWPCGLHADWTEHKECVPKYMNKREGRNKQREFYYVTIVREPVSRFLSEFSFVGYMGTMWRAATLRCNGRSPTKKELPMCFPRENLSNITLDEFMNCPWNLAINRQTRMLADLRLVNCYNTSGMSTSKRNNIMLKSAMKNLEEMTYFGLVEYQAESQYLFEKTFGLKFFVPFTQVTESETKAGEILPTLNNSVLDQIKNLNSLDLQLYKFAKNLFFKRITYFKETGRIKKKQHTE